VRPDLVAADCRSRPIPRLPANQPSHGGRLAARQTHSYALVHRRATVNRDPAVGAHAHIHRSAVRGNAIEIDGLVRTRWKGDGTGVTVDGVYSRVVRSHNVTLVAQARVGSTV
jgi:hypothetical protein